MACRDRVGRSPHSTPRLVGLLVACALAAPPVLSAQYADQRLPVQQQGPEFDRQVPARDDVPAHVAIVDGAASLEREGRREVLEENTLLLAGDRLRTERGRVEVLFDDGSVIDVDEFTSMDLLSDSLLRLTAGRIRLTIARVTNTLTYRVDAAGTTSWIQNAGEYRVAIRDARATSPEVELSVFRGLAELETPHGKTVVRTGAQAFAVSAQAPSQSYAVNVAIVDDFDRWTEAQRDDRLGSASPQYLPAELRYYGGELDDNGSWGYEESYGAVWYPRVDVGWRPYYHGRWSYYGSFGWTWVGGPRWAWPTHHYGRWGYSNRWYWIPGRKWAPAYVSWGYYPGYVSWCPLGYTGYPVIPITHATYFRVDPFVAWTVVPSKSFVHDFHPARYASAQPRIAKPAWSQFATRNAGPVGPVNVNSRTTPLRSPTYSGQAVSRNSAPAASDALISGSGVTPQWRSSVDADGTTRVRPSGAAPSRVAPATAAAPAQDRSAMPARSRSNADVSSPDRSASRSQPVETRETPSSMFSTPLTTAPFTRSAPTTPTVPRYEGPGAVRRSPGPETVRPAPNPGIDQPSSREVMPAPSRTPSRSSGYNRGDQPSAPVERVYRTPSVESPNRPEPRGSAVPRSAPPSVAPGGGVQRAPESSAPRSAPPSRVQPPSRSAPPAAAAPPSGGDGGSRSAPPASSGGRGRAVSRGGGVR